MVCKMLSSTGTGLISPNQLQMLWQSTQKPFLQQTQPQPRTTVRVASALRAVKLLHGDGRGGLAVAQPVSQPCFHAVSSSRRAAFLL